jgi:hypothetical protein
MMICFSIATSPNSKTALAGLAGVAVLVELVGVITGRKTDDVSCRDEVDLAGGLEGRR